MLGFFWSSIATLTASVMCFSPNTLLFHTSVVLFVNLLKIELHVEYLFRSTPKYSRFHQNPFICADKS